MQDEHARNAHNIEPLEKQVISQEDVSLEQVLVVRVYSSADSAVWGWGGAQDRSNTLRQDESD